MSIFNINFKSIDWDKIGGTIGGITNDLLKSSAPIIIGGAASIAMAVICKKLDIPYQVLSNPYDYTGRTSSSDRLSNATASLILMPNNPVEAGIYAIASSISQDSMDYTMHKAAEQIMDILKSNRGKLSESTIAYAITTLKTISDKMMTDFYKNKIGQMIVDISKGGYTK